MRRRLLVFAQIRIIPVSVWVIDGIGALEEYHYSFLYCIAWILPGWCPGSLDTCKLRETFEGKGMAASFEFMESEFSIGNWRAGWLGVREMVTCTELEFTINRIIPIVERRAWF